MVEEIALYDAIKQMRKLTSQDQTFCFVHACYDRNRQSSEGIRVVKQARLRPAAKDDDVQNADFKLFYFDEEIQKPRNCWQILIMYFEGKKVVL